MYGCDESFTDFSVLQATGDQGKLVDAVLALLGLEANAVADTDTMESLGMDSMQVAEVRARLQRALGRTVPLEEVAPCCSHDGRFLACANDSSVCSGEHQPIL